MNKDTLIKEGFKDLEKANYDEFISLFTSDARVKCPIYGHVRASNFFKAFFADTLSLKTIINKITQDPNNSDNFSVDFDLIWTLKEGQVITANAKILIIFNSKNKATYIEATYNFISLS